jgi:hypothetical protein
MTTIRVCLDAGGVTTSILRARHNHSHAIGLPYVCAVCYVRCAAGCVLLQASIVLTSGSICFTTKHLAAGHALVTHAAALIRWLEQAFSIILPAVPACLCVYEQTTVAC